jgi:hypothetical protein
MPSAGRTEEGGGNWRIVVTFLHLSIFRREETRGIAGAVPIAEIFSIKRREKELNAVASLRISIHKPINSESKNITNAHKV